MTQPRPWFRRGVAAAVVLLASGCSTLWTRGAVESAESGEPIPGARARVLDSRGSVVASSLADARGCFFLQRSVPRDERHFSLEIVAPGFEPARFDFRLQTPVLIAALAPRHSERPSAVRAATSVERANKWEPRCIPVYPPGAQELAPR